MILNKIPDMSLSGELCLGKTRYKIDGTLLPCRKLACRNTRSRVTVLFATLERLSKSYPMVTAATEKLSYRAPSLFYMTMTFIF